MQLNSVLPTVFGKLNQSSTFLSINGYKNNYNAISNYGLVFNVDYINIVLKSLYIWRDLSPKTDLEKIALEELILSYEDSLHGLNPRATSAHVYEKIFDKNAKHIKGVKWFKDGEIHLSGLLVHSKVITPGKYPIVKRGALASIKYGFRKMTPLSKWRQFKLTNNRFESINIQKLTLTQQDLIEDLK